MMKQSEGYMFNQIFKENVQGQKRTGRCVVSAETKLPCFRNQNEIAIHIKIPMIVAILMMKQYAIKELSKSNTK